ncbi:hypothetical protein CEXT_698471 [Caerostris extrusa]|uniref:Uncharacterized protein n=1 Tax=Caerostris extrusa TaxID=172846 RepID=A0AAV4XC18_CAEEX|nr:hypothetical protein CEXT_698471 [Caerostris extrusa]
MNHLICSKYPYPYSQAPTETEVPYFSPFRSIFSPPDWLVSIYRNKMSDLAVEKNGFKGNVTDWCDAHRILRWLSNWVKNFTQKSWGFSVFPPFSYFLGFMRND